jgi:predicted O-methyltransferase YrrM
MKPDFTAIEKKLPLGAFSIFDMECIYPALKAMKKSDIYLEVGVDKGKSLAFARKVSKGDVYGVDIQKNPEIAGTNFIHKPSNEAVKNWTLPIDVLFIDGDHSYEGAKADWDNFSPFVVKGGWVFFHDADVTSPGVVKLVKKIGKGWENKGFSDNQQCSMAWVRKK